MTGKILNITLKILSSVLIVFTILMVVFTIFSVTALDRDDRSLFGFRLYIVEGNSMSPSDKNTDIETYIFDGDILLTRVPEDARALESGEIITFTSRNSDSRNKIITHMIRRVEHGADGETLGYVTYGTNSGADDEAVVRPSDILGVYVARIPFIGSFFAFLRTGLGYVLCILLPLLALIVYYGVKVFLLFKRYKRERAEVEAAEAEEKRREAEAYQNMAAELVALRARISELEGERGLTPGQNEEENNKG